MTLIALAAGLTLVSPADTAAQDADDTIVVTATKIPTPIDRVPLAVTVLDDRALERAVSYLGAEDLVDLLPGVEAAVANGSQVAFQIRGIGAVDHQALTPTAAAVYSDGVYLATNVQTGLALYDLERVEVLKGPQGTLYGRNASGGAINLVSARPSGAAGGRVALGFGSYDRAEADVMLEAPLSNSVSTRLAATWLRRDPVLDNVAGPRAAGGQRDQAGVRLSTRVETGATDVLLRAHYEREKGINPTPRNDSLEIGAHQIASEGDGIQDTNNRFYGVSGEVTSDLGAWSLFSLTAFEGYDQNYGFDFDGTPAPFGVPSLNANLSYDRDFAQVSQEVRLTSERDFGRVMVGAMAAYEDFDQRYTIWCGELDPATLLGTCRYVGAPGRVGPDPASDGTATTLVTDTAQERVALALFTYNQFALTDRLELTAGARLTHEVIDGEGQGIHIFDDGTRAFNNRDGLGPAIGENRIVDTRVTGNIALSYDLGSGTAYASIANGYKSGGFNGEVANNATFYSDEGLFGSETVTAYEVGYKLQASTLRVSLAGFYQDYADPQARIFVEFPLPDGSSIVSNSLSNLDEAVSYGVDLEAAWTPLAGWDLDAGLVYNRTRIDQDDDLGGNAALFDGNPLPFAPRWSATLGSRYAFALGAGVEAMLSAHAKYRTRYYLDPEGLEGRSQPSVLTVQAEAGVAWPDKGVSLTLWGRNLTNRDTALSGYGFIGYNSFRSDPRTFGARLGVSF